MTSPAALHSKATCEWGTPPDILDRCRRVLGTIELDPCSNPAWNQTVRALHIFTVQDSALEHTWSARTLLVNPPGGVERPFGPSWPQRFWAKLLEEREAGRAGHTIWIGFSLEQLQSLQGTPGSRGVNLADFPMCIPRRRLKFVRQGGGGKKDAPPHGSVIVYVPPVNDLNTPLRYEFFRAFSDLGVCR